MNPLFSAAAGFLALCRSHGWRCCAIGGLAVQRWGEPRQTRDVDLTLFTDLGAEEGFVDAILAHYGPRFADARRFALEHRVLLVETADGVPLDISLGALPYESRLVERASLWEIDGATVLATCSAEDLVVLKAFANRPRDWVDIEGVVVRQGHALNRRQVRQELAPLLDLRGDSDTEQRLLEVFARHES